MSLDLPSIRGTNSLHRFFSRSGNISPKFYRILREARERAGVPCGRGTPDGLVLHDARHTATTHLLESNVVRRLFKSGWVGQTRLSFCTIHTLVRDPGSKPASHWRRLAGRKTEEACRKISARRGKTLVSSERETDESAAQWVNSECPRFPQGTRSRKTSYCARHT